MDAETPVQARDSIVSLEKFETYAMQIGFLTAAGQERIDRFNRMMAERGKR